MSELIQSDQSTVVPVRRAAFGQRALRLLMAVLPWAIIGSLLWAGLFIKPRPVGAMVTPPQLERRDHFYGLAVTPGGEIWASGSNGKILALTKDGVVRRMPTPTARTLQDVAAWDDSHAVAVGNDGVILFSQDAGLHWSAAINVPRSEVANKLSRVRIAEGGLAIATGEMGALLISHDYGQNWQRLREEEDVAWNDVAILGEGRLVVVGEFGRILRSEDLGQHWEEIQSPLPGSLMSAQFRDAQNGVAVGLEGALLVTGDGGRQWQKIDLGIREHLFDVMWSTTQSRWFATGALGRWVSGSDEPEAWKVGTLDNRNLSWHTLGRHINDHVISFYLKNPDGWMFELGWAGRTIGPDWQVEELPGMSLWGHDRTWLPPQKREAARQILKQLSARGVRAPVVIPKLTENN